MVLACVGVFVLVLGGFEILQMVRVAKFGGVVIDRGSADTITLPDGKVITVLQENSLWANLPSLLWPLVALVAIAALFLIARKAISSGSNVVTWKVTEKVTGRVVITKILARAPSRRAAT